VSKQREEVETKRRSDWRRRYVQTPFIAVTVVLTLALTSFSLSTNQTLAGCFGVGLVGELFIRARWGKGKHRDPGMSLLMRFVVAASLGLICTVRFALVSPGWIFVAFLGCLAVFGGMWWFDNRNIRQFEIEVELERWPELAKKIGLEKVKKTATKVTETGKRTMLWWSPGDCTLDRVRSNRSALEAALQIPEKRLRFEMVKDENNFNRTDRIWVVENTEAPSLKAPVPFDRPSMRSIQDLMVIGLLEDGSEYAVRWYQRGWGGKHTLAAGRSRSGKSGLYHLVLAESALCPDVVRWGIDRKGGMTLKPWAPLFDWLVTDDSGTMSMMTAVREVLEARSKYAADMGWDTWKVSPKRPLLIILIDECAEVFGFAGNYDATEKVNSIARMGAAAGVLLLVATQHPTNEALSSTQLTKNISRRFCFSVEDFLAQRVILPNSTETVDATQIPLTPQFSGTCFTSEGGEIEPKSLRVRFVTFKKIRTVVTEVGDNVPTLDALSNWAAEEATVDFGEDSYAERRHWVVEDLPPLSSSAGDDDAADDEEDDEEPMPPGHPAVLKNTPPPTKPHLAAVSDLPAGQGEVEEPQGGSVLTFAEINEGCTDEEKTEREEALAAWHAAHVEANITTEQAEGLLRDALRTCGKQGTTINALTQICGRQSTWIHDRLTEWMKRGVVERPTVGQYRWVEQNG
jgi:S-DNA-T family DNA segregation ATPase FtsK/SpoIIIE